MAAKDAPTADAAAGSLSPTVGAFESTAVGGCVFKLLRWDLGPEFFGGEVGFVADDSTADNRSSPASNKKGGLMAGLSGAIASRKKRKLKLPAQHWFTVRCVDAITGLPDKRRPIQNFDVTVSVDNVADDDLIVDMQADASGPEVGWCHHNYAFVAPIVRMEAQSARTGFPMSSLIRVSVDGVVVLERVVRFAMVAVQSPKDVMALSQPWREEICVNYEENLDWMLWLRREKPTDMKRMLLFGENPEQTPLEPGRYGSLLKFRSWAKQGSWEMFGPSHSHYDWWMFPIAQGGRKPNCAVGTGEVHMLRADAEYMSLYREGVLLMFCSWGWDVITRNWLEDREPFQVWKRWPVRLAKLAASCLLFGEMELFNSARMFLKALSVERLAQKDPRLRTLGNHMWQDPRVVLHARDEPD